MKRCDRCHKWFHEGDSAVCDPCWEDMGQMTFFHDEDIVEPQSETADHEALMEEDPRIARVEAEQPRKVVSVGSEDWEDRHPITSVFDQDGYPGGGAT